MPLTRGQLATLALFVAIALGALYYLLPRLAGLDETWNRIRHGDPWWLGAAVTFELLSFGSCVGLFRRVFLRTGSRIGWRESYQITMAGLAATRLFAAAGAGGIVLTVWALRRSGMNRREVAARMTVFIALLYGIYMLALLFVGLGLSTGLIPGGGSPAITLVPAIFGSVVIALALALVLLPRHLERHTRAARAGTGRLSRWTARAVALSAAVASGVRGALAFWLPTIPGAFAYLGLRRTVKQWQSSAGANRT